MRCQHWHGLAVRKPPAGFLLSLYSALCTPAYPLAQKHLVHLSTLFPEWKNCMDWNILSISTVYSAFLSCQHLCMPWMLNLKQNELVIWSYCFLDVIVVLEAWLEGSCRNIILRFKCFSKSECTRFCCEHQWTDRGLRDIIGLKENIYYAKWGYIWWGNLLC